MSRALTTTGTRTPPFWLLTKLLWGERAQVWIRFLLAILGLALAFVAALFSTLSREAGDLSATLILASLAILLATVVGLTTIPYLARRVAIAREVFDYDITRVGVVYVLVAIVIGVAALNTANNLLYIVVATMLAAMVVSGIASAIILRNLELDVRLPQHVFAGRAVRGWIVLGNRGRLPSFSVSVGPGKNIEKTAPKPTPSVLAPDQSPRHRLRWPLRLWRPISETSAMPGILEGLVHFPYLAPCSKLSAELDLSFSRRGRYRRDSFAISTGFPFAFVRKTRPMTLAREVIVYPSIEPTDEFFQVLPLITGEFESLVRGRGYDLYRIREYMPEDSARHLDWKATAKSGSPKVREFTREDERKLRIIFDNPSPGLVPAIGYENAVRLAASLAWHFAEQNTDISFISQGYSGSSELDHFLTHLATVEPHTANDSIINTLRPSRDYNIILTARTPGTIPTPLWACSYFIFINQRG